MRNLIASAPVSTERLTAVLAAVDEANTSDPNTVSGRPRALVQGELATKWLSRLVDDPSFALQVAARAHHLKRWELKRTRYPQGRAGYLRWRRDNKAHQAAEAAVILDAYGYDQDMAQRVGELLQRRGLGTDAETQALEDVACLVFLQTQFDDLTDQLDHDHLVGVVRKTLKKMSADAITLAGTIAISPDAQAVLVDATAPSGEDDDSGTQP